jgi:hypothetical protein
VQIDGTTMKHCSIAKKNEKYSHIKKFGKEAFWGYIQRKQWIFKTLAGKEVECGFLKTIQMN